MEEHYLDETLIQDMLDWLSRCVEPEKSPVSALAFTEEDYAFLRASGIALPL